MKVFVAGATGRVAGELIKDLVAAGHDVIAGARRPEAVTLPDDAAAREHILPVHLDLHDDAEKLSQTLQNAQAVYFVAGSRGKDLLQTDAFGAVKLMQAAQTAGAQRFVMLSSLYSLQPEEWGREQMQPLLNYTIAKFFADNYLTTNTTLDYTILQPSNLTEEAGTGTIATGEAGSATNAIPDVAATLAKLLDHPNTIGTVIRMGAGSTPIDAALSRVQA